MDIFISAGQKQMNQLDITASAEVNTEGLDFVLADTRFNILENKVALAVPEGNPKGINSYADLVEGLKNKTVIFYVRVWVNEGELKVGDDMMLVLIGGDIRPRVMKAMDYLVGRIKTECVTETEHK